MMQLDFHYYATYCAAFLAGYTHEESLTIAYSAQFVDCCSQTLLTKISGPVQAATTQTQLELADATTSITGLQDITRIWASFHFLPVDLNAKPDRRCSKRYLRKYRLICGPDSELIGETVELARDKSLQAAGLAMHVLADTWAHRYFAGTPSLVINNTNDYFYEIIADDSGSEERPIRFNHNPTTADDIDKCVYTNALYQSNENSIMNLGHGRAGHLPDYCWARYRYLPAWGDYKEVVKDNPKEYLSAFCQMVYALRCLRTGEKFETGRHKTEEAGPWLREIAKILLTRQLDSSSDWKALGEKMSGCIIEAFNIEKYQKEYILAQTGEKDDTFLGKFILAALAQKSMVTNRIYVSGSKLAGYSIDYHRKGFRGIKDFQKLVEERRKNAGA